MTQQDKDTIEAVRNTFDKLQESYHTIEKLTGEVFDENNELRLRVAELERELRDERSRNAKLRADMLLDACGVGRL